VGASSQFRYGPSRSFVAVVGIALAVQVWHALPSAPRASDTADLERTVYGTLQAQIAISDVRCARTGPAAANCIATLPDLGRTRVRARLDPRSGEPTAVVIDTAPPLRLVVPGRD
jgi:hypothetical protein